MRVLVTGGRGFVGLNLVEELKRRGHEVAIADTASHAVEERVDIRDIHDLEALFSQFRPEAVVHLAALASVPACERRPFTCFDANVRGTWNVTNLSVKHGARLVFMSSAAVYGDPCRLPTPVSCSPNPTNVYGLTKHLGEEIIRRVGNNWIIFRLFNAYGPKCRTSYVIPDILRKITHAMQRGGDEIVLLGSGDEARDFIYVRDVVRAVVMSLEDSGAEGIFNLGTGTKISIRELAETIIRIVGVELRVAFTGRKRPGDFDVNWADISGSNSLPGWSPTYDLESGLKDYMRREFPHLIAGSSHP